MKVTVKVVGLAKIERKLRAMRRGLQRKTLVPIMKDAVEPIAEDMRRLSPRRTGELADSITVGTRLSRRQRALRERFADIEVYAGPGPLPQAVQEEFGNAHQRPHPFIRPAFDAGVDRAVDEIAEKGIAAIMDAAKSG